MKSNRSHRSHRNAFTLEVLRGIRGSMGRFLAILGIVALGCGFFAGLLMCGPDMRQAADSYYDGCALCDLRLVSTSGFEDADVERVQQIEGISAVMPAKSIDAMATMGDQQVAVRMTSIDCDAAAASTQVSDSQVDSDDPSYLNRPRLVSGRWPRSPDECVISADKLVGNIGVGDTVQLVSAQKDLGDLTTTTTLTVVGTVSSPEYPYTGSFGSTNLGSGSIEQYLYVPEGTFADSVPYTQLYLQVDGASQLQSGSDAYQQKVGQVKERLERQSCDLAKARLDDLRSSAQQKIDDAKAELETNRADAQEQLDQAKAQLDQARLQIEDGRAQYQEGVQSYQSGVSQYQQGRAEALRQIAEGQASIDSNAQTLRQSLQTLLAGEKSYRSGLDQYQQGMAELLGKLGASSVEEASSALDAQERQLNSTTSQAAQSIKTIQDAQSQLDQQASQAQAQIDEGQKQITDGLDQLDQKERQLKEAQQQLADAQSQLLQAAAALGIQADDAQGASDVLQQAIDAAKDAGATDQQLEVLQTLKAQADQLVQKQQQLGDVDAAMQQIAAARQQLQDQQSQLRQRQSQLEQGKADAQAQIDQQTQTLLDSLSQRGIQADDLDQAQTAVDAAVQSGQQQIAQARTAIRQLESSKQALDQGRAQLDAGWAAYEAGAQQLAQGQEQLDQTVQQAYQQLAQTEAQLAQARQTLDDSLTQLQQAQEQLDQGQATYDQQVADAQRQLDDAQAQIDDAQAQVDALEAPKVYVLDHTQSEGCAAYQADSERMDHIASVFPLVFFLVAALVALTTMTRMVEDDRQLIGTLKALGYGTGAIAGKYLAYAALAGVAGAVVGIALLCQVLPLIVTSAYSVIYPIPLGGFPLPVDLGIALGAGGLGVGLTLLATWLAVLSSLRETPATLMLPRAPKPGKRILLEHVAPLWSRMSFSWKVTCRNIFRYKRRLFMTVVGIAGCSALLLTGFGLHDSIWDIIDGQFGPIVHYDTTVGLSDDATDNQVLAAESYLRDSDQVTNVVRLQTENMQAGSRDYDGTLRVSVEVPRSSSDLSSAVTLRDRQTHDQLPFDDQSVVLAEKTARLLGVGVGDRVSLYAQDEIGNATGDGCELTVTGICENYVGNVIYVGRKAWSQVDSSTPRFLTLWVTTSGSQDFYSQAASDLRQMGGVSTVSFVNQTIQMYEETLSVVNMVVVVLIVSAALLAAIVLFNLTNINISERIREIASLKVLGFTRHEVYAYIFREVILLAAIGDLVGMVLGVLLEGFVINAAEVDYVMFGRVIHPASFAISFALTMVFTLVIVLMMRPKLDRVSMVESLKSVD